MNVAARRGEHTWSTPPHRSSGRRQRTSTTSHRSVKCRSRRHGADDVAHRAVCAVAAEHRVGAQVLLLAGPQVAERDPRSVAVRRHGGDGDALPQGHRPAGEGAAQQDLEVGLVEQVGLGMAVPARGAVAAELGERAQAGVEQAQSGGGPADRRELLVHADPLQDAHRLAVEVHGAWQPGRGRSAGRRPSRRRRAGRAERRRSVRWAPLPRRARVRGAPGQSRRRRGRTRAAAGAG